MLFMNLLKSIIKREKKVSNSNKVKRLGDYPNLFKLRIFLSSSFLNLNLLLFDIYSGVVKGFIAFELSSSNSQIAYPFISAISVEPFTDFSCFEKNFDCESKVSEIEKE